MRILGPLTFLQTETKTEYYEFGGTTDLSQSG